MKNLEKSIKSIESFEEEIFHFSRNKSYKEFRNINNYQWVENKNWPFDAFRILNKVSIGNVFPGSFSLWWNNFKFHLGYKVIHKRGYKNLVGYLMLFPFTKKHSFPLMVDVIFFKRGGKYVVLFYLKENISSVFKVNIRYKDFVNEINQEVKSQQVANTINCDHVGTPKLKSFNLKGNLCYLEQELVSNCKSLKQLKLHKKNQVLKHVFNFIFEFYKKNGLKSVPLQTNAIDFDTVKETLIYHLKDDVILLQMKSIINKKKKMIYGRVHGDLCYNNILVNPEKIYIIDWGLSGEKYFCEDLIHKLMIVPREIKMKLFNDVIQYFNLDSNELYTLEEQLFLTVCIRLFKTITGNRNRMSSLFGDYVKMEKKVLIANNLMMIK